MLPKNFTIEGRLFDPSNNPYNATVDVRFEVVDSSDTTCVLYREDHTGINVASTDTDVRGRFSLKLGSGTQQYLAPQAASLVEVFTSKGFTGDNGGSCSVTPALTSPREVVIYVIPTGGAFTATDKLSPNVTVTSVPGAMIAETLQGYTPSNFLSVGGTRTDANINTLTGGGDASSLHHHDSLYVKAGSQVGIGTTSPTTDIEIAKVNPTLLLNSTGAGTSSIILSGSGTQRGRIEAASGSDGLTFYSGSGVAMQIDQYQNVSVTGSFRAGGVFGIGQYTNAQETSPLLSYLGSGGAASNGSLWYNSTTQSLRLYANQNPVSILTSSTQFAGDIAGSASNISIVNDKITSAKINSGFASNMLLSTDATTGSQVTYVGCGLNQVMTFDASGKWSCSTIFNLVGTSGVASGVYGTSASVGRFGVNAYGAVTLAVDVPIAFPVTSVAGKTGNVTLTAADISLLGTAAMKDYGTSAGNLVELDGSARIPSSLLPDSAAIAGSYGSSSKSATFTVDSKGRLTASGEVSIAIEPNAVNQHGATANQVLTWNGSAWTPANLPAGSTGDMTDVLVGFGLSGGASSSAATISLSPSGVTANSYGAAATIPVVTVDAFGRVTNVVDTTIALPPTQINQQGATLNQVLKWNGSAWFPAADADVDTGITTLVGNNGIFVTGTATVQTIAVDSTALTLEPNQLNQHGANANQVLTWNGSAWIAANLPAGNVGDITDVTVGFGLSGGAASGNAVISLSPFGVSSGSFGNAATIPAVTVDSYGRVAAIINNPIALPTTQINQQGASINEVLKWNGSAWAPGVENSNATTLQGYPISPVAPSSPSKVLKWNNSWWEPNDLNWGDIISLNGINFNYKPNNSACSNGQVLKWQGNYWDCSADTGGISTIATGFGLSGGTITTGGTVSLQPSGVVANTYGSSSDIPVTLVDAFGRVTAVTNTPIALPTTQINQQGASLNQVLTWNGSAWMAANLPAGNAGDITDVIAGAGLSGGGTSSAATISLQTTAVTAGSYGSASQVSTITVDNFGRLTNAASTAIVIEPNAINQHGATANQVLAWNGSAWAPASAASGDITDVTVGFGLSGGGASGNAVVSLGISGVTSGTYGAAATIPAFNVDDYGRVTGVTSTPIALPTTQINQQGASLNQTLKWNGSAWFPATDVDTGITTLVGNSGILLSGTSTVQTIAIDSTVLALEPNQLRQHGATANQVLAWNGSAWAPASAASGDITDVTVGFGLSGGAASGGAVVSLDISGVTSGSYGGAATIPAFNVDAYGRVTGVTSTPIALPTTQINQQGASLNQVLTWNGSAWMAANLPAGNAGDITDVIAGAGLSGGGTSSAATISLQTTAVTAGSYGSASQVSTITVDNFGRLTNAASTAIVIEPNAINQHGATANQVLAWNGSAWAPATAATGDITDVTVGFGLSGGAASGGAVVSLNTSGVSSGSYGGAATIPAFSVDSYGRVTSVTSTPIALPTTQINQQGATLNQTLKWNGSAWFPATDIDTGITSLVAGSAVLLSGTSTVQTIAVDTGIGANQVPKLDASGRLALGTATITNGAVLDLWGTGTTNSSLIVPRATSAGRPTGVDGMIRYNTSLTKFEVYENGNWANMVTGTVAGDNLGNHTATQKIVGITGTANSPSYGFPGLAPRGLFGYGTGGIAISTGATPRIYVQPDGEVDFNTPYFQISGGPLRLTGGNFRSDDGSQGAPAYSFESAQLTGMFMPGADELAFSSFNNEMMRITPSRVGIGTTIPSTGSILDVNGTGVGWSSMIVPRGTSLQRPSLGINGMIRYNTNLAAFEVYAYNSWQTLTTSATASAFGDNLGNHQATTAIVALTGTALTPSYTFSGNANRGMFALGTGGIAFSTGASARFAIMPNGDIGIGTTAPQSGLEIYNSAGSVLHLNTPGTTPPASYLSFENSSVSAARLGRDSASGGSLASATTPFAVVMDTGGTFPIQLATNGAVRMTISASGRIGFNTTNPTSGALADFAGAGTGTSSIIVPRDTSANRPVGINGMIRYNTNLAVLETYQNGNWTTFATSSGATNIDGLSDARVYLDSTYIGNLAGIAGTGTANTALGEAALKSVASGSFNTAIGTNALMTLTTGGSNTAIGNGVLSSVIADDDNTAIGDGALQLGVTLSRNTAIGSQAGNDIDGLDNVFIGDGVASGASTSQTDQNVIIGSRAGRVVDGATSNIFIGYGAGETTTTGSRNVLLGFDVRLPSATDNYRLNIGDALFGDLSSAKRIKIGGDSTLTNAALEVTGTSTMTSAMIIPRAASDVRPLGVNGMIRYNTNLSAFEVYANNNWATLSTAAPDNLGNHQATSSILGVTGTAGTPSYAFAGNTSSGLFSLGAGGLGLSTQGTARIRVFPNGFVGIGTANPVSLLHVGNGGTAVSSTPPSITVSNVGATGLAVRDDSNSVEAGLYASIGGVDFGSVSSSNLNLVTGASVRAVLDSNGRMQIGNGTNSGTSGAILDLKGTGVGFSSLLIPRDTTALRPTTGVNGMIRYNTNLSALEVYANNNWGTLSTGGPDNLGNHQATSAIIAVTGTASAPSYAFSGASNFGMYAIGTAGIGFSVASLEAMRIDSLGSVGIGTTNPIDQVHIHNATSSSSYIRVSSQTSGVAAGDGVEIGFDGSTNNLLLMNYEPGSVVFSSNGAERMRVQPGGSLAIATTATIPGVVLNVNSLGSSGSTMLVPRDTLANRPTTGVNGMIRYSTNLSAFEVYANNNWATLSTAAPDNLGNHTATSAIIAVTGTASTPSYTFSGNVNRGMYALGTGGIAFSTATSDRMRILPNGYIGIGTANPTSLVHIGNGGGSADSTPPSLTVSNSGATGIAVRDDSNTVEGGIYSGSAGFAVGTITSSNLIFYSNNLDRGAIDSSGRMQLGNQSNLATVGAILDLKGTGIGYSSLLLPRDTTALRPTIGVNGMLRYNTNTNFMEVYGNGAWLSIGGTGNASFPLRGPIQSVGSPTYSFQTSPSTGMYMDGAGGLAFAVGGTNTVTIDNTGQIGMGTTQPSANLQITQSGTFGPGAGDFSFLPGPQLLITNEGAGNNPVDAIFTAGTTGATYLRFGDASSTWKSWMKFDNFNRSFEMSTLGSGAANTRMKMDSAGRMVIGGSGTTVGAALDVVGTGVNESSLIVPRGLASSRANIAVNGMIRYNTNSASFEAYGNNTWNNLTRGPFKAAPNLGSQPSYTFEHDQSTGMASSSVGQLALYGSGSVRLNIDSSTGDVTIPSHLYVNGGSIGSPYALEVFGSGTVSGDLKVRHLASSGPTITTCANGAGAGGGTCSLSGKDIAHAVTVTTGGGPSATAGDPIVTVTFANSFVAIPVCTITPINQAAGSLSLSGQVYLDNASASNYVIRKSGTTALGVTTAYRWNVICIEP